MSCSNPYKGFIVGTTDKGKKDLKIVGYDAECVVQRCPGDKWEAEHFVSSHLYKTNYKVVTDHVVIPCGQCAACRLEYARQWAIRCMLESQYHDENYFVTLTYDDEHVPWSRYVDQLTGELVPIQTLVKKDMQDFFKRVRADLDYRGFSGFRYFCCGEYGDKSARPHYHAIMFGLHLDDLVQYEETEYGILYESEFLTSKWRNGRVIIGGVTFQSCSYVARYVMKKQKGKSSEIYDYYNIVPEFTLVSRRPGIAKEYFLEHFSDIYRTDSVVLPEQLSGSICVSPPRSFDVWMTDLEEIALDGIKAQRKEVAEALQELKLSQTDMDIHQMWEAENRNLLARTSRLVRPVD